MGLSDDPAAPLDPFWRRRNMGDHYRTGKVIGAGSFGTVREAVSLATGLRYAVKTVSKVPKRGPPTPRCAGSGCAACVGRQLCVGRQQMWAQL